MGGKKTCVGEREKDRESSWEAPVLAPVREATGLYP